jgi:hypothetical protein
MQKAIAGLLIVVGLIQIAPVTGVRGADRLSELYGLSFDEPNLAILMRHRAVLFGLLGAFLIYAAIRPAFLSLAFIAGFVSIISFLAIAWAVGNFNSAISNLVKVDLIAAACLSVALILFVITRRQR